MTVPLFVLIFYCWLVRVTLVVTFGFVLQNFRMKYWTYKWYFCSYMNAAWVVWAIKGGADTQKLLGVKKNFSHSQVTGMLNFSHKPSCPCVSSHARTWTVPNKHCPSCWLHWSHPLKGTQSVPRIESQWYLPQGTYLRSCTVQYLCTYA